MKVYEVAMAVAEEFGLDVQNAVEFRFHGKTPRGTAEVLLIAGFIVQCASLAIQIYASLTGKENDKNKDAETIEGELKNKLPPPAGIDDASAQHVISSTAIKVVQGSEASEQ